MKGIDNNNVEYKSGLESGNTDKKYNLILQFGFSFILMKVKLMTWCVTIKPNHKF